jgi:hypothetical protein
MWLPSFLYESLPFWYLGIGGVLIGFAFATESGWWPEIFAAGGLVALVIGLALILRRKGYRASRSRIDFDETP